MKIWSVAIDKGLEFDLLVLPNELSTGNKASMYKA